MDRPRARGGVRGRKTTASDQKLNNFMAKFQAEEVRKLRTPLWT